MRGKSMILIMIALGCGLVASIGISQILDRNNKPKANVATKKIFVAVQDVDINKILDAEMIKLEEWPADKVPEDAITSLEDVKDLAPNQRLFAGEPIRREKLIDPNKGGDDLRIPKGFRVQAIKVDAASSVANLVRPGHHVDVLVYLRKGGNIAQTTTKTILQDVRVFAVNAQTIRETDEEGNTKNAKTVSLLLQPEQVETILMASRLGTISLSLRRPDDDTETVIGRGVTPERFLIGGADDATPDDEATAKSVEEAAGSVKNAALDFQDWLDSVTEEAKDEEVAQVVNSAWTVQMMTPDGITTFEVSDDGAISKAQEVNTSPAPATPAAAVDPDLPADADQSSPDVQLTEPANGGAGGASIDDQIDEPDVIDDADLDPDA